jgi:hypothetical protein
MYQQGARLRVDGRLSFLSRQLSGTSVFSHRLLCVKTLLFGVSYKCSGFRTKSVRELAQSTTHDQNELEFGHGSWLQMIRGKHVLRIVIDKHFRVKDATGKYLQGDERCMEVVKSLLKLPLEHQPDDFNELYKLISTRVSQRI